MTGDSAHHVNARAEGRLEQRRLIAMTYVVTEPCIDVKHGACVDVRPVSCIYFETDGC